MSWFPQHRQRTWLQRVCETVLMAGPIPRHVAIIMDGNRRFAVKNSLSKLEGHIQGFDKLAQTLEWCLDLGIQEVTVYAFSIENFKRSPDEVNNLMELSKQKFKRLLEEKELISKHGVCVRIIGDISLLPRDLQELLAEAITLSTSNTRAILNVCFAYTAQDDMCHAMRQMVQGVKEGHIKESDISENLLEKCLYTSYCRDVDLLIRTSGEVRLSDFLLWESTYSCLAFVKVLWPDFSVWHLYAAILHYQRQHDKIQIARQNSLIERERLQRESDYNCVKSMLERTNTVVTGTEEDKSNSKEDKPIPDFGTHKQDNPQSKVKMYAAGREKRIKTFLTIVNERRMQYIKDMLPSKSSILLPSSNKVRV